MGKLLEKDMYGRTLTRTKKIGRDRAQELIRRGYTDFSHIGLVYHVNTDNRLVEDVLLGTEPVEVDSQTLLEYALRYIIRDIVTMFYSKGKYGYLVVVDGRSALVVEVDKGKVVLEGVLGKDIGEDNMRACVKVVSDSIAVPSGYIFTSGVDSNKAEMRLTDVEY